MLGLMKPAQTWCPPFLSGEHDMTETTLVFVDGENLAYRYQEMIRAGRTPAHGNVLIDDCFVWNSKVFTGKLWNIKRVSYYTSVVGDDDYVGQIRRQIADVTFSCSVEHIPQGVGHGFITQTGRVSPSVRKKASKSRKESICDISIAVDVMRACYRNHADSIWIFSGDGDFIELVSEAVHSGKVVYVSAFSSGLNENLTYAADEFFPLDKHFFV
jgi:uncharacterized LabA/DUF88 family protein